VNFKIGRHDEWVGNWCWDAVWMDFKETLRLCRLLKKKQWEVFQADKDLTRYWFDGKHAF